MGKTKIEWTDETWNPVTGCSKVSPGCENCYAEKISLRFGWSKRPWTKGNAPENVVVHEERLDQPLRWKKPRMIFVNSMSDLFHEQVPDSFIEQAVQVMLSADHHIFQILTKRPERMKELLNRVSWWAGTARTARNHIWLGTSIESQRFAHRVYDLLDTTEGGIMFVSAEPLLGPLQLSRVEINDETEMNAYTGQVRGLVQMRAPSVDFLPIDWVIIGGESGPGYRPMEPRWAEELMRDATDRNCPVFMKQMAGKKPIPSHLNHRAFPGRAAAMIQGRLLSA